MNDDRLGLRRPAEILHSGNTITGSRLSRASHRAQKDGKQKRGGRADREPDARGLAGASFGWMRQRSGSTKAAALMHAAYNGVFFFLLAVQQVASHGHWAGR